MKIGIQAMHIWLEKHAGVSRVNQSLVEAMIQHDEHEFVLFVRHDFEAPASWHRSNTQIVKTWSKTRTWNAIGRDIEPLRHRLQAWFSASGKVPRTKFCPSIGFAHDTFWITFPETYTDLDKSIHQEMYQNNADFATRIACNSQATAKSIAEHFGVDPCRLFSVTMGPGQLAVRAVPGPTSRAEIEAMGVPPGRYLFTLSTLEPRKNFLKLAQAFSMLIKSAEFEDLHLVIAGGKGWKFEETQKAIADLGISEKIHFLGYVPDEVVPALFAHCEAAVTASLDEGFGLPVLEAMRYGAPVCCSATGALSEVAGDVAIYFDPHSVESIESGLRTVLGLPDRNQTIDRGFQRAERFSWEASAQEILDSLAELVVAKKAR